MTEAIEKAKQDSKKQAKHDAKWLVCSSTQSKINIITIKRIKPAILDVRDES